jgi:hypothetical protein
MAVTLTGHLAYPQRSTFQEPATGGATSTQRAASDGETNTQRTAGPGLAALFHSHGKLIQVRR